MNNKIIHNGVGVLIMLIMWQICSSLEILNPIYFASPYEVAQEGVKMFNQQSIYKDIFFTLKRILASLFISASIGIPLGIMLGYFSKAYKYVGGILDFLRSIPPIVIYPLLLIMLGVGDSSRIGVAVFGSIIIIILIISKGLTQEPTLRRKYHQALGFNHIKIIKKIIRYEALPHIIIALRTAISIIIIVIIVTEMLVGAKHGLGVRVQNVQVTSNIPDLFMTIIIIGILGVTLNQCFVYMEKKAIFRKK